MTICKSCIHNCNPKEKRPPIIANKPNAICWCNAQGGRAITKKYKQCKFYEPKGGKVKTLIVKCWVCGKSFEIKPARAKENFYLAVCPKCKEEIRKENSHGSKEKE